jgi:hypothetical protein
MGCLLQAGGVRVYRVSLKSAGEEKHEEDKPLEK